MRGKPLVGPEQTAKTVAPGPTTRSRPKTEMHESLLDVGGPGSRGGIFNVRPREYFPEGSVLLA